MKNKSLALVSLLTLGLGHFSGRSWASDLMDTRITFTISDDNVLQGPMNTNPASPTFPNFIGSQNNTQFYDNYDTRYTGFETMTHLAMYKKMPSFFKRIDTEANLVVKLLAMEDGKIQLGDAGSFLRLVFPLGVDKENNNINLTAFPVSSDRFRNGYSFAISWGGNSIFPRSGIVPGLKLSIIKPRWYAFIGGKTALVQRNQVDGTIEKDTAGGVLAGAGVDITSWFRLECNGGYFDRGTIDKREVRTKALQGFGASFQAAFHQGIPIGTSIDLQLYRNDPDMPTRFFTPELYDNRFSWVAKSEFTVLGQNLQDLNKPSSTRIQQAMAADVNFAAKYKKWRFHLDAVYRTLSFILYNVPSNPSYANFPDGTTTQPEIFVAAGFDYFFAKYRLTPGFKLGVQRPAYYKGAANAGNNPPPSLEGVQTFVFRDSINVDILDPKYKVQPIVAMTGSLKWDISEIMSAIGQVLVRYDTNKTTFQQDGNGIAVASTVNRSFLPPWSLGFNLILQARF